jgi:hypothetical protein
MTFVPDSRKPTHVQNVYLPQDRTTGELSISLAVRGFKAPQNPGEFRLMLEREIFEAAKKDEVTPPQLRRIVEDLLSQETSYLTPYILEQDLERLVDEVIELPEVYQEVSHFQFPATRQATLQEKQEAKNYLEERNVATLLDSLLTLRIF